MVPHKLVRSNHGGTSPVSIKYENLHSCKECVILLCQSILETIRISHLHGSALFKIPLRDLCTIDGFVFIDNTNLSDCDICEDLLHFSYSGTCKLANNVFGVINKNLEKSNF